MIMTGDSTPHSLFAAAKRERAVEPSKRKNAWRGTCAVAQVRLNTGAVLANCHQSWSLLLARAGLVPRVSFPRVYTAAVIAGGYRKAHSPSPADAIWERQRKSTQGVSGTSQPPPRTTPRAKTFLKPDRQSHRAAFFSLGPGAARSLFGKTKKRMGGAYPPLTSLWKHDRVNSNMKRL